MWATVAVWLAAILMSIGSLFVLLAAVGVVRLPDLFTRMQASTKSSTLGVACILLAVALHFGRLGVTTQALLVIAFFFLTTPVATHMIARAAYLSGVPLWDKTVMDDLQGRYDIRRHTLSSPPSPAHGGTEHASRHNQARHDGPCQEG